MDWSQYIFAQDSVPQTFTTSHGDDEQSVPQEYAESVCTMFAQLGARGSSIMFNSGDDGIGIGDCKTNDRTNRTMFQPEFPASCECLVSLQAINSY
jgi:tripeptidyl-peptidase I